MTSNTKWPSTPISPPIKAVVRKFFSLVDEKSDDIGLRLSEQIFTPTGEMLVGKRQFRGLDIVRSRDGAWDVLKKRKHEVIKLYTFSDDIGDILMFGKVFFVLENGTNIEGDFAARVVIDDVQSETPQVQMYQGWTDPSEIQRALKEQQKQGYQGCLRFILVALIKVF